MKEKVFLIVCFFSLVLSLTGSDLFAQKLYRDPFQPRFPEKPTTVIKEEVRTKVNVPLPSMTVSGILHGKGSSKAIINGKVYTVGDIIEGTAVKVHRIEKNKLFVLFQGGLFEVSIISKDIETKESR
ncbi:MAG: hypothetical protein KKF54_01575 [Candidatus Omnitrophica bacterium]|nr:hypothetical protein [Candidatus Omnitrophota bacterium]